MNFLYKNEVIDYTFLNKKKDHTILFLHGWGGNKFSFHQTINLLKKDFNVLTLTMPTTNPTTAVWNLFDYANLTQNLLKLNSISSVIIICHSFGFRVAMLLNKKIKVEKLIVTGGAGLRRENIFKKIIKNNNLITLKKSKKFYNQIASLDYQNLSPINKKTFNNIVTFNLTFLIKFNCPILLFWGAKDNETKLWIARKISRVNKTKLLITKSDHFAYINESAKFNYETLKFLKN